MENKIKGYIFDDYSNLLHAYSFSSFNFGVKYFKDFYKCLCAYYLCDYLKCYVVSDVNVQLIDRSNYNEKK